MKDPQFHLHGLSRPTAMYVCSYHTFVSTKALAPYFQVLPRGTALLGPSLSARADYTSFESALYFSIWDFSFVSFIKF